MPCESCAVQFSVFRRKRSCSECERYYCSGCLRRGGGVMCMPCRVLSTRPLSRQAISHLKVRDLQCFLQRQNISTRGCVEKDELVSLCVSHVNSTSYRRRGSRASASAFSSLKGFTNNINDFIHSAFDIRNTPYPTPTPQNRNNCFNNAHVHPSSASTPPQEDGRERFTTTPGGERDIFVPVPEQENTMSNSTSLNSTRIESADCFEIEDLYDLGWEMINRPADPLPNDSEVLLESPTMGDRERASSLLELRPGSGHSDTASLRDEPLMDEQTPATTPDAEAAPSPLAPPPRAPDRPPPTPRPSPPAEAESAHSAHAEEHRSVTLEELGSAADLERLSVRQLKELLVRNRVEIRGCVERQELSQRAATLLQHHLRFRDELDRLPLEDCCKICMAAPLECVLLECGHIAACTRCSRQLAECPICRRYVSRAVRCFKS